MNRVFRAEHKGKYDSIMKQMQSDKGIGHVRYQSTKGLIKALGMSEKALCLACLNGEYPTKKGEERAKKES